VPLEEYLFFMLQTLMTGLWVLGVRRHIFKEVPVVTLQHRVCLWGSAVIIFLWLVCGWILLSDWNPGTYLALILLWALPPVLLQWLVGGDILVANWKMLLAAIAPPTAYLWLVDAIAIRSGTWTIDPEQTTGFALAGLPLEEMLFFLMTNLMIAFGISLMLSAQVHQRLRSWVERVGFFTAGNAAWE
jgi:lycopene cyclase domain-containing protein